MEEAVQISLGETIVNEHRTASPMDDEASQHGFASVPRLVTVKELLSNSSIRVPYYQRPYKWSVKNVNQLLDDILLHRTHSAYRLGTLVLHKVPNDEVLHIVDGQQRCVTLTLIALAIYETTKEGLKKISKEENAHTYRPKLVDLRFSDRLSQKNIQQNFNEIKRRVREFDADALRFFYCQCELVEIVILNISEAFQFFDSQNARGRDLEPHDLLKAFHLREMNQSVPEQEKLECVAAWEAMDTGHLASLFGNYLYRVRNWSKGYSGRYFTKNEVAIFKGVNPHEKELAPYASLHRIGHFYIEAYNNEYHRQIDATVMQYPFQLDSVVINGKRFFELVNHYRSLLNQVNILKSHLKEGSLGYEILETLDTYSSRVRIGDKYVRNLFECGMLYYIDKFGTVEINRVIEKIFVWAYSLRLQQYSVKLASIDLHALGDVPLFKIIREALHPAEVLAVHLEQVSVIRASRMNEIKELFKKLHYYHGE